MGRTSTVTFAGGLAILVLAASAEALSSQEKLTATLKTSPQEQQALQAKVDMYQYIAKLSSMAAPDKQVDSPEAEGGTVLLQQRSESGKTRAGPAEVAPVSFQKCAAEFIAMTLFVVIGCGSACGIAKEAGSAWVLQVALTFGFAITVLAYTIGHYSGGQINCAVTFGLMLAGEVSWPQGLCNIVAQILGSVVGAGILTVMYPQGKDLTGGLGSNGIGEGWTVLSALLGETAMTFLLMYTVFETAVNPLSQANRSLACIAIGLAVFLAHSVLIPIDGCSINPTRTFGPALVAKMRYKDATTFKDMWVFWVGPLLGAFLAWAVYSGMA